MTVSILNGEIKSLYVFSVIFTVLTDKVCYAFIVKWCLR